MVRQLVMLFLAIGLVLARPAQLESQDLGTWFVPTYPCCIMQAGPYAYWLEEPGGEIIKIESKDSQVLAEPQQVENRQGTD